MKKLIFAAVVATLSLTSASASADCWFFGTVYKIFSNDAQNYSTVYAWTGSYFAYARVPNSQPQLLDIVRTAAATGNNFTGRGDIASCASTGINRYAGYLNFAYFDID